MVSGVPTHEQAQLQLQLYDLRREARLRQARDWFFTRYFPQTLEESNRQTTPGSEESAFVSMVISYWEQACALLNYGLLHEDLFFETSGEFYGVWLRMKPLLAAMREQYAYPPFLQQMERAAARFEKWMQTRAPEMLERMPKMMEQMRQAAAGAAESGK